MKIGKRCRIGIGTRIVRPKEITLSDGCIVNDYCHLDGRGSLIIDDETSISIYTKIISASHDLNRCNFQTASGVHLKDKCIMLPPIDGDIVTINLVKLHG